MIGNIIAFGLNVKEFVSLTILLKGLVFSVAEMSSISRASSNPVKFDWQILGIICLKSLIDASTGFPKLMSCLSDNYFNINPRICFLQSIKGRKVISNDNLWSSILNEDNLQSG